MHTCITNDIVENYLSLAHNCKLSMKHAKFGIINQHMNAHVTCITLVSIGQFNINYIILKNVEVFKFYFFQIIKYCEGKY
jgi:hypothetical protein